MNEWIGGGKGAGGGVEEWDSVEKNPGVCMSSGRERGEVGSYHSLLSYHPLYGKEGEGREEFFSLPLSLGLLFLVPHL